jgi:tetratricopeptide (TPR) repeat protein
MSAVNSNRATALLRAGFKALQEGRVEQARLSCEQALKVAPRHPDALNLLGVIALKAGAPAAAVERLRQAVSVAPGHAEYQANLAYGYVALKQIPEALAAFQVAARLEPRDPELQLGIGNCLGLMGRLSEAEAELRRLVEQHPQYALGWFNLAKALDEQERYEEACELYRRATQLAPQSADGYTNLGHALSRLQRFEEAERAHRASIACRPDHAPSYVNLAIVLNALRRLPEGEAACREALRRDAQLSGARIMLGRSLARQGRFAESLACFEEAAASRGDNAQLLTSLGSLLACYGRTREALEVLESARSMEASVPRLADAMSYAFSSVGRMHEGAAASVGRDERCKFTVRHPERSLAAALPVDLKGKRVCLLDEQGIGDQIFFLRYAPQLKLRGSWITLSANGKLAPLLARSGVCDEVLPRAEAITATHDYTCLVGDLPYLSGSAVESSALPARSVLPRAGTGSRVRAPFPLYCRAYWPELPPPLPLQPLAERIATVSRRLEQLGPPPYLGLTWRAGTGPDQQRGYDWQLFKEIPLPEMAGALRGVAGTLVYVQRNPHAGETERLAALVGKPVHDLSAANGDLEETLALMSLLDEYVGVSNTNMHLRASVGKPARVLVPWPAEWRWLVAGDESPWFPGFRIYRQGADGNWTAALDKLARELAAGHGQRK